MSDPSPARIGGPTTSAAELRERLRHLAAELGLAAADVDGAVVGSREAILCRWFLGGRKVIYRMSCAIDEAVRDVRFREVEVETSWGIPPPSVSVEKTTLRGGRLSGIRRDTTPCGGGELDYAAAREAIGRLVFAAGWQFRYEPGRMPLRPRAP